MPRNAKAVKGDIVSIIVFALHRLPPLRVLSAASPLGNIL
jgi:hypothetical protein